MCSPLMTNLGQLSVNLNAPSRVASRHSKLSGIETENWDCLLVYMCSPKLPKLTMSLWEQSLHNKAEIPSWQELISFLTERHRTLEAINDVRPSVNLCQKHPPPRQRPEEQTKPNFFLGR